MYNEKAKERTIKYLKTLKEVRFRVKPEEYAEWEKAAKTGGFESMRQYYIHCINKETERISCGQNVTN